MFRKDDHYFDGFSRDCLCCRPVVSKEMDNLIAIFMGLLWLAFAVVIIHGIVDAGIASIEILKLII